MRRASRALALAGLTLFGLSGVTFAESPWKNLQFLPKDIKKDELKAIMKAQAKALGVECDHCHQMPDADKDTKPKKAAREMMQMTFEVNKKYMHDPKEQVTCYTCHRGKEKPDNQARPESKAKPEK